jgi:hypothetical protein
MYHPELYPDLAKNNVIVEPIRMPAVKVAKKIPMQRPNEITVLDSEERFNSLAAFIVESAAKSKNQDPNSFTSEYQVKPILHDIAEIGRRFFASDEQDKKDLENMKEKYELRKTYGDDFDVDNIIRSDPEDDKLNQFSHNNPIDLYKKKLNWNAKRITPSLREIVREMQDEGTLSRSHDLRSLPYDTRDKKNLINATSYNLIERRKKLIESTKNSDLPEDELKVIRQELKQIDSFTKKLKERIIKFETLEKCNLFKKPNKKYTPSKKTKSRSKRIEKRIKLLAGRK